ncbi:reverse transcriptase domain-containing protein [Thioclava sp. GXIMD4216]|uniref:reverse transcriptase domain-containing protein n=1 Tax=Thioclava sp. GXIMD4216 TaxID=3131929 RepID=UPI0030CA752B
MEDLLKEKIELEARRRLKKWRKEAKDRKKRYERFQKKTGMQGPFLPLAEPALWGQFNQFNPFYCIKKSKYLARVIVRKVREGTYKPQSSVRHEIPKPNGSVRLVDAFGIPDAALCTYLSSALRERNDRIFSAYSYAYRPGVKPIDAIARLAIFIKSEKVFASNYDFKDYFGSVSHDYIHKEVLNSRKFKITNFEKTVISALLTHEFITKSGEKKARSLGFPQGNSLSLFLANAVGDSLDRLLDKSNGNYLRYADDSIVITYSYEDSIKAMAAYSEFSQLTRVKINTSKETGISIVSDREGEMRTQKSLAFLGYELSKNKITLTEVAKSKLKSRCSKIIYRNLLMYPKRLKCIPSGRVDRFGADWDLLACISELRFMLYGHLSHDRVKKYLDGRSRLKSMPGSISYYCLVEAVADFSELDGWLVWAVSRALVERYKYPLYDVGISKPLMPANDELIDGSWLKSHRRFEGRLPSFVLAWRAARKAWFSYGNLGVNDGRDVYELQ